MTWNRHGGSSTLMNIYYSQLYYIKSIFSSKFEPIEIVLNIRKLILSFFILFFNRKEQDKSSDIEQQPPYWGLQIKQYDTKPSILKF